MTYIVGIQGQEDQDHKLVNKITSVVQDQDIIFIGGDRLTQLLRDIVDIPIIGDKTSISLKQRISNLEYLISNAQNGRTRLEVNTWQGIEYQQVIGCTNIVVYCPRDLESQIRALIDSSHVLSTATVLGV